MKHIFRYEFKKMRADGTLWALTAILFLFTLLALFNGGRWADFQRGNLAGIAADQEQRLARHLADIRDYDRENDFIHGTAPQGFASVCAYTMHYVAKPPHPNAIFAIGQSDLYACYVRFSALHLGNMLMNEEVANPVNLLVGKLDYSFFLVYLLPLLVIAMAYDLLAAEREQGTLTLLRIYQPQTLRFLLAKWLFRALWVLATLCLGVFAGLLAFSPFALWKFGLGTLAVLGFSTVYVLFWFALCFAVNMLGRNALFNGIALSMFWLFVVFLLPTMVNTLMEKKYPVPSRNAQIVQEREIKERTDRQKAYEDYLRAHPEYPPIRSETVGNAHIVKWYPPMVATSLLVDSLRGEVEKPFRQALAAQENGLQGLSYASPSLMASIALNRIARNALGDFEDFDVQVRARHRDWRSFVYDRIFRGQAFTAVDIGHQPNFIAAGPRPLPMGELLLQMSWMLAIAAALMALGLAAFRKNFS